MALLMLAVLVGAGCGGKKASVGVGQMPGVGTVISPAGALVGKVISVNPAARFAVLNFPIGRLPALEQRLSVYRQGLRVGEVKVTGPQRDDNIVADVVAGDVAVGDQVRSE
jgi:hypothetical protein